MTEQKIRQNIESSLVLDRLVFEKIEFTRLGFGSDDDLKIEIQSNVSKRAEADIYKVALTLKGRKEREFLFEIILTGFFNLEGGANMEDDLKRTLVTRNSVAIMMPYMRSEVSLLTAQPGMECVVLPAFNINKMLDCD